MDEGKVIELVDGSEIAGFLKEELSQFGAKVNLVSKVSPDADVVIFLGGLNQLSQLASIDEALEVNRAAFRAAKTAARKLASQGGVFVTVQRTGGGFGLTGHSEGDYVWTSGLSGLVKTAAKEWPKALVKAIDLALASDEGAEAAARRIAQELLFGGPELEVGLSETGERRTLVMEPAACAVGPLAVDAKDTLLVSGGARGVTAGALLELAKQSQPRMILLGRTPLEPEPAACVGVEEDSRLKRVLLELAQAEGRAVTPADLGQQAQRIVANREVRRNLAALREAGSEVEYAAVDVQDSHKLAEALKPIRAKWGPITGIIHGAGVLADKAIADKTDQQFDYVFQTKVNGLRALLEVTRQDPLKLLVLFSSVAARSGNAGQADYAMANEILNKVAHAASRERGADCHVKSINWGPWDGGMVNPGLKKHFEDKGLRLIPMGEGAAAFVDELRLDAGTDHEIVIGGGSSENHTLIEGPYSRAWRMDIRLHQPSQPYLADHCLNGNVVVPAALVMEWFAKAAKAIRPELNLISCNDVTVKKGILVETFQGTGSVYKLHALETSDSLAAARIALQLYDADGIVRYTGEVVLGLQTAAMPAVESSFAWPPADGESEPWSWDAQTCYGEKLFHGPAFQVLEQVRGVGDQGVEARLHRPIQARWAEGDRVTDPVMTDGAMQLLWLWSQRHYGYPALPTTLGQYVPSPAFGEEPAVCRMLACKQGAYKVAASFLFLSESGQVVAELRNAESHFMMPSTESRSDSRKGDQRNDV